MNLRSSLVAAILLAFAAAGVRAEAPLVKTNPPAFYRMLLGSFEVTALSDGTVALPIESC